MLTSRDNPLMRDIRRLLADTKYRRDTGRFAAEGARLCHDAAVSGIAIESLLYTARARTAYAPLLKPVLESAARAEEISPELAAWLGDTQSPQGVFCLCDMPGNRHTGSSADTITAGRWLALEDMRDPGNLGAVIRTAEALGLAGVVLSDGCCDIYSPKVLRSSMGGVFRLPLLAGGDFAVSILQWQAAGLRCLACVPDADAVPVTQADFGTQCLCFIGNEGDGLRAATISACDGRITIPMRGRAESLGAAMAAGIVAWQLQMDK